MRAYICSIQNGWEVETLKLWVNYFIYMQFLMKRFLIPLKWGMCYIMPKMPWFRKHG